jgi:hypothetical protein
MLGRDVESRAAVVQPYCLAGIRRPQKYTVEAAMKFRATSFVFSVAALFLAALYVASAAQAFTIEDQGGGRSGQAFTDLDKPAAAPDRHTPGSPFNTDNGQTSVKQGNTTFQFGQQRSFNERYNTNNLFDPYAREGR